ncbi:vacuolar membrane protein-domain-containing protein [Polychytrium aggregatum]|uniref:vacuolar membrane protein-domain-containing protein n=1 Tax=Polychytrium aggregatum TaxID=110093 RepID=UPI0022FE3A51|nr:vacuolar membrane protein-domain-containing protein [Polychytrium aggregatum]KAI9202549.1 vacuolar membrane protein-domain-containing protein [Polychytrium aggregatum]
MNVASVDDHELNCKLMDGFAIAVQVLLGTIVVASLLFKRFRERPRRPIVIWFMDTSKQGFAALIVHFVNVALSDLSSSNGHRDSNNPCVWYFLNIMLDTTIGVAILYMFLRILHSMAYMCGITDMHSGDYGNPPRFYPWYKQLNLFIIAWVLVKTTVVLALESIPAFATLGKWLLQPLIDSHNVRLQVLVVMLVIPLIMNIVQAWLTDAVIKARLHQYKSTLSINQEEDVMSIMIDEDDTHSRLSTSVDSLNDLAFNHSSSASGLAFGISSTGIAIAPKNGFSPVNATDLDRL